MFEKQGFIEKGIFRNKRSFMDKGFFSHKGGFMDESFMDKGFFSHKGDFINKGDFIENEKSFNKQIFIKSQYAKLIFKMDDDCIILKGG